MPLSANDDVIYYQHGRFRRPRCGVTGRNATAQPASHHTAKHLRNCLQEFSVTTLSLERYNPSPLARLYIVGTIIEYILRYEVMWKVLQYILR